MSRIIDQLSFYIHGHSVKTFIHVTNINNKDILFSPWFTSHSSTLRWRQNGPDGVSNHQPHDCLFNRLFSLRSTKHQSSAPLAFVRIIQRWPVNFLHKAPVTRKIFPFDDVIMKYTFYIPYCWTKPYNVLTAFCKIKWRDIWSSPLRKY